MNTSRLYVEPQKASESLLTELIFTGTQKDSAPLIFPMLAHLSRQTENRWLTWIGSEQISKDVLEHYSFDTQKIRFIKAQNANDKLWMLWDALNNGTSSAVIAHFDDSERKALKANSALHELESAANTGNTRAVLLSHA